VGVHQRAGCERDPLRRVEVHGAVFTWTGVLLFFFVFCACIVHPTQSATCQHMESPPQPTRPQFSCTRHILECLLFLGSTINIISQNRFAIHVVNVQESKSSARTRSSVSPRSHGGPSWNARTHIRRYARTHVRTYARTHIRRYARTHVRTYAGTHIRRYA